MDLFQHTAARRRLEDGELGNVSYHSFNTQPPEGGWYVKFNNEQLELMFQHTAARRRLADILRFKQGETVVSTHSRPKAAGSNSYD